MASGSFVCADGRWIYLRAISPEAWKGLIRIASLDPAWSGLSPFDRRPIAAKVYERLEAYCATLPSEALVARFSGAGVSAVLVRSIREVLAEVDSASQGLVRDVADVFTGTVPVPTGIFASAAFGAGPQRREPLVGEHSREVLRELGRQEDEIERLISSGKVMETLPPSN